MDEHLVHTIPNHHPTKMDDFVQIIHSAKWLQCGIQVSLPTISIDLLYLSTFYAGDSPFKTRTKTTLIACFVLAMYLEVLLRDLFLEA